MKVDVSWTKQFERFVVFILQNLAFQPVESGGSKTRDRSYVPIDVVTVLELIISQFLVTTNVGNAIIGNVAAIDTFWNDNSMEQRVRLRTILNGILYQTTALGYGEGIMTAFLFWFFIDHHYGWFSIVFLDSIELFENESIAIFCSLLPFVGIHYFNVVAGSITAVDVFKTWIGGEVQIFAKFENMVLPVRYIIDGFFGAADAGGVYIVVICSHITSWRAMGRAKTEFGERRVERKSFSRS